MISFFKELERISNLETNRKLKQGPKIKIPEIFLRLLLQSKSKLLLKSQLNQLNKINVKNILSNRQNISQNNEKTKTTRYCFSNQKYKPLEKKNYYSENNKFNSPLPCISQNRNMLNLRYQEDPRDFKKYQNLGKELIHIQSKNNFIKTEAVIPNSNINKFYLISKNKRFNSNENLNDKTDLKNDIKENQNYITEADSYRVKNLHMQNMTFVSPFPKSVLSRNYGRYNDFNNIDELYLDRLMSYLYYKYNFKRQSKQLNNSNSCDKNNYLKLNIDENEEDIKSNIKKIFKNNNININQENNSNRKNVFKINNIDTKESILNIKNSNNNSNNLINKKTNNEINEENINLNINNNNNSLNNDNNFFINHNQLIKENNNIINTNSSINNNSNLLNNKKEGDKYNNFFNNIEIIKKNRDNNDRILSSAGESINNDKKEKNIIETPKKRFQFEKNNLKNFQINIKPLQIFNSFSSKACKTFKGRYKTKLIPISLLTEFKIKYSTQEQVQQKLKRELILFPLNTNVNQNNTNEPFYYFINKMYRNQFTEYMKHRTNWELITKDNNDGQKTINFSWKYMSNRLNFKNYIYEDKKPSRKLRIVNLFERNYEVGNKKNLFINLINYCDKININTFNLVPFTIIINNTKDVDYYLEGIKEIVDFVNKNNNLKNDLITNRNYSAHFWFDKNFENLERQYININKNFLSEKNYWILKPTDLYQGKCIEICNSFEEINKKCKNLFKGVEKIYVPEIKKGDDSDDENFTNYSRINLNLNEENNFKAIGIKKNINEKANNSNNHTIEAKENLSNINNSFKKKVAYSKMYCSNELIIQKYLDRPLLYFKRKFDIRCFVLVDSNLNVFFCREGHLKGSSEFYNLNNTNKLIHITNYSLQKKSSKFEQYEDGNEISYNDFKKYMEDQNIPLVNFNNMINQMKYLVEISFKSVGTKLIKTKPVLCFEIFGYDFIIDRDFKPWILEINNNPGLCISSPVIQKLVPRMLDDAFRLTIDKIFETRYSPEVIDSNGNYKSKYKIDGYTDEENIFEFLCNVS